MFNKTNISLGAPWEKKKLLKVLPAGRYLTQGIRGKKSWEGVSGGEGDQHWVLSYSTAVVDPIGVRKLLNPEFGVTGNDTKSLPMPQLPCSLEAGNCQGYSLESSFTAHMHVCQTLMSATAVRGTMSGSLCHSDPRRASHWQNTLSEQC